MKQVGAGAAAFSQAPHLAAAATKGEARTRPNVVVIFCDQLRSQELGCYGHPGIQTPNIDRLAAEGVRFDLGFSNAPTCVPARSNLLTGQYARTCAGARGNECPGPGSPNPFGRGDRKKHPDPTLPEVFKGLGYHTAQIGKWHVDTRPSLMGFDESCVTLDIFSRGRFARNEGKPYGARGFSEDYQVVEARKFFERDHDKPFFLYYNIVAPHMPVLDIPYQYSRMYDPANTFLRDNVWKDGKLPHDERWFHIYMWQTIYKGAEKPVTAKTGEDFDLRNLTALYDGAVTWVDDLTGHILASLEEQGLADNTIVLFSSDHGDLLGSHHLWNKARLYDEAARVPMIVRWPEAIAGGAGNRTQVTSLVDIMPTLIDLCDGEVPSSAQGQSVAPILRGQEETLADNCAIIETPYRELGVRTPTHLFGVKVNEEDTEIAEEAYAFHDMREDPYQMRNLAGTDEQRRTARELLDRLRAWRADTPKLQGVEYKRWV